MFGGSIYHIVTSEKISTNTVKSTARGILLCSVKLFGWSGISLNPISTFSKRTASSKACALSTTVSTKLKYSVSPKLTISNFSSFGSSMYFFSLFK
jgi:hypothetical protein